MSSIDVIVPCYRYGRYLRQCIQSVLTQDIAKLRVLIIDDESPDDTPYVASALAQEDSRVTYLRHSANRGHIRTYNEGIDWAEAEYTLLISADDYLLPGALRRALAAMDSHPGVGLCFGEALELQESGETRPIKINVTGGSQIVMGAADFIRFCVRLGSINPVPTPTAVVRTRLLKALGGYRTDLPHSGDLEMWLRLAAHAPVCILKTEQAVYRRHSNNMSNAYSENFGLADVEQRKAAFEVFRQSSQCVLPQAEDFYRSLLKGLGNDAVGYASSAFNAGHHEISRQLCEFALTVHPGVWKSLHWNLLACKRLIGARASNALLPTVSWLRSAFARTQN